MSFVTIDNFDVEHASSLLIYENLFPMLQHINGKGVTDKYTKAEDIRGVNKIDVLRILPYIPNFRKVAGYVSGNNKAYTNALNGNGVYDNAPQSTYSTVDVDLFFDRSVPIPVSMVMMNRTDFREVVMKSIIEAYTLGVNAVTFAKQIEGFFRNGDNFDKALTHTKGSIVAADITASEIAAATFQYKTDDKAGATEAFLGANESLNEHGIPEIGAFVVPVSARQAFISGELNKLMKGQYEQNASEASARILATGWMNPFNDSEGKRIDERTGLCGMYDGVDLFRFNDITRKLVYISLGILGTASDATYATVRGYLDKLQGFIVYGAGTLRGMTQLSLEANKDPYNNGTIILAPLGKVGVECIHGATIKCIVNGVTESTSEGVTTVTLGWTGTEIAALMNALTFTPIDGVAVTGASVLSGFNSGATK